MYAVSREGKGRDGGDRTRANGTDIDLFRALFVVAFLFNAGCAISSAPRKPTDYLHSWILDEH
jgi:hypothetical protein